MFDEADLDVSDFAPKPAHEGVNKEQVRAVAEPAAFRSREAAVLPPRREPRRYRTGRNVQLNLKVRQEDADAFYALADEKGWVLGEAFQRAVQAPKETESR
ncbi:MAG: hypothetical protein JOZ05_06020 [Acetobacteraceae bacterium]|nr:hypothetical protein [Acetobacteraceae bacterium]